MIDMDSDQEDQEVAEAKSLMHGLNLVLRERHDHLNAAHAVSLHGDHAAPGAQRSGTFPASAGIPISGARVGSGPECGLTHAGTPPS